MDCSSAEDGNIEAARPSLLTNQITIQTADKSCTLVLEARPLPPDCISLLEKNTRLLKALNLTTHGPSNKREEVRLSSDTLTELEELREKLNSALVSSDALWEGTVDRIWSFGPRHTGPNLLVNSVESYRQRPAVWDLKPKPSSVVWEFDNSIVSGFQLATLAGPLCEEPMHGVCVELKEWSYSSSLEPQSKPRLPDSVDSSILTPVSAAEGTEDVTKTSRSYGPFSGQLISAMKEGCRRAFLAQPARLMVAMYTSSILATADVLGRVYGVLGRRNGRVLSEEMKEGSAEFSIQALVPVAESFGFAEEIRKKTSGLANPQLIFSHWEVRFKVHDL